MGCECKDCKACMTGKCKVADIGKEGGTAALLPIQQVHWDFIIPKEKAATGEKCSLVARCAASKLCWVFPLKNRSLAGAAFDEWLEEVLAKFDFGDHMVCELSLIHI